MSPTPTIDAAAAVNSRSVLSTCLAASPDIRSGALSLTTYEGCTSAPQAYNRAISESAADVVVLVHQDVYLPAGFLARLRAEIASLEREDPDWGVLGVIGLDADSVVRGQTWSSGIGDLVGVQVQTAQRIVTLDEVILIVRTASGLRFDEDLPGFHMYGADIVQTARKAGIASYVANLPLVHHSRPVVRLDASYRRAYRHLQRKWRADLPIPNLICAITASPIPLLLKDAKLRWRNRGKLARKEADGDPSVIARRLGFES